MSKFQIGDEVRVMDCDDFPELLEKTGIVVYENYDKYDGLDALCLVQFQDWHKGHNGGGIIEGFDRSGLWFRSHNLKLATCGIIKPQSEIEKLSRHYLEVISGVMMGGAKDEYKLQWIDELVEEYNYYVEQEKAKVVEPITEQGFKVGDWLICTEEGAYDITDENAIVEVVSPKYMIRDDEITVRVIHHIEPLWIGSEFEVDPNYFKLVRKA